MIIALAVWLLLCGWLAVAQQRHYLRHPELWEDDEWLP